jgi:NitT/TauT family transport system ATP-binding protein
MVFQEYTAFDNRTVLDNVAFGLECSGVPKAERHDRAMKWIAKVGLSPERDALKYPHQLSGGMRQRVAIARTLILNPRIVLMDEPFGALDPMTRLRMQDLLSDLWSKAEATVFFVTHSIEEAVFLGDRIYLFSPAPGTIIEEIHCRAPPTRRWSARPSGVVARTRTSARRSPGWWSSSGGGHRGRGPVRPERGGGANRPWRDVRPWRIHRGRFKNR